MKNYFLKLYCVSLIILLFCAGAFAQTQTTNKWDKVKQAARLTRAQQEEINNQKILQDWFMAKIQFYLKCGEDFVPVV